MAARVIAHVASGPAFTVPCMSAVEAIHPWGRFGALGRAWKLIRHHDGVKGLTHFEDHTISLRMDLTWEERRCTILHETLHAERGPALDSFAEREELRVRKETARLLLPNIRTIGEALAWSQCRVREAAEELGVDADTLWDRLDYLHPSEMHYLRNRLQEVD